MKSREILRKPYARRLTPDETGGFVATIGEFPGLVAEGDTAAEAYANLERAAESWIEAALEIGTPIPEPAEDAAFSGKFALRMPRSLHRRVAEAAGAEGTSLNQLVVTAVAFYMGRTDALRSQPSDLKVPNARTRAAMREARALSKNRRARFDSAGAIIDDLKKTGP